MSEKITKKFLIVEDNQTTSNAVAYELWNSGYEFVIALNGAQCLDAMSKDSFDLLILDYELPDANGLDLLKQIKSNHPSLPVIMVTGRGSEAIAVSALKAGAKDYILKSNTFLKTIVPSVQRIFTEVEVEQHLIQQQEALKQSENTSRVLLDASHEAAMLMIKTGEIEAINERARSLFSLKKGENASSILAQFSFESETDIGKLLFQAAIATGQKQHGQIHFQKNILDITFWPISNAQGEIHEIAFFSRDITREMETRKALERSHAELEARLRQAQRLEAIGTLAGGIAHDFNNILFPIMGYTELALRDKRLSEAKGGQEIKRYLEQILTSIGRAKDMVEQILSFSRQSESKQITVRLNLLLKEVLKLLRVSFPATIKIEAQIPSESIPIHADPTQIHQVLMNLCTNALHAMKQEGGTLTLKLESITDSDASDTAPRTGGNDRNTTAVDTTGSSNTNSQANSIKQYGRITVRDTGYGMRKEVVDRIFDPYFTTKGPNEGSGMGLAIVHGIVQNHHGHIHVESEPGKGSVFRVDLPRVTIEKKRRGYPAETVPIRERKGTANILIVDDEKTITQIMSAMVIRCGYHPVTFNNPETALSYFKRCSDTIDLVISDITMPEMTGVQLARQLISAKSDLPIILCTGFSDTFDKQSAEELGIKAYLQKPIDYEKLIETIQTLLSSHQ